MQRIQISLYQ